MNKTLDLDVYPVTCKPKPVETQACSKMSIQVMDVSWLAVEFVQKFAPKMIERHCSSVQDLYRLLVVRSLPVREDWTETSIFSVSLKRQKPADTTGRTSAVSSTKYFDMSSMAEKQGK